MEYRKKSEGKPNMNKLYGSFLREMARGFDYGDNKYGKNNWHVYGDPTELISASQRHIYQFSDGEEIDIDSGLSHLALSSNNNMMLYWHLKNGTLKMSDLNYHKNHNNELLNLLKQQSN